MFGFIVLDHFGCDSVGLVVLAMLVVRLLLPCFKSFLRELKMRKENKSTNWSGAIESREEVKKLDWMPSKVEILY
ncbi:unnamed protein product [Camellia sinensis]